MTIWFDMDGTLNKFYDVPNWLPMLQASDPTPYIIAKPNVNMSLLARYLHQLQNMGYEIGVISWLSKTGTANYNEKVIASKYAWLRKHLPSVKWDAIHIIPYGTPKQSFAHSDVDVLFDDEERNRIDWTGTAYDVDNIFGVLASFRQKPSSSPL